MNKGELEGGTGFKDLKIILKNQLVNQDSGDNGD